MPEELLQKMREKMEKSVHILQEELTKLRTGRANPAIIEDVKVSYYGTPTPLKHIANIVAPDPELLVVRPYDPTQIEAIQKGILQADLGLNPMVENEIIRIKIPKLSEERRVELGKLVREKGEETKVSLRNIRREVKEELEELEKKGEITEDELYLYRDKIDKITHEYTEKIDKLVESKGKQLKI